MKLGVPSKGRLKKEVLSWFYNNGVEIITSEDDRSYAAKVTGFTDIQFIENQIKSATDKNFSEIKKNIQNKYSHLSEKSVLRLMELFIKN